MGQPDTVTKNFIRDNEVFAEIFNYLIYGGKEIIKPENLTELDTAEIIDIFDKDGISSLALQKFRDILKSAEFKTDGKVTYCLLAVENQTKIHYGMPVKNGLYDFIQYSNQIAEISKKRRADKTTGSPAEFLSGLNKEDSLNPVITLTISFSGDKWDGPMTLHEMFKDVPKEILALVPDYRINLIEPFTMSKEDLDQFKTDFGAVMEFIKHSKNKKELLSVVRENDKFKHLSQEAARVADVCTNGKLTKFGISDDGETEGDVNVCKAIDDLIKDTRQEGFEEGLAEAEVKISNAEAKAREAEAKVYNAEAKTREAEKNTVETIFNAVINVMEEFKVDSERAMKVVGVPDEFEDRIIDKLDERYFAKRNNFSFGEEKSTDEKSLAGMDLFKKSTSTETKNNK